MKKILYNIFIWISGVDLTLLKDCPESEHKKYAQIGGLIMIPTMMAFASMLYASTLLTNEFYSQLSITIIWTLIIFIIDRYLVSTFIKSEDGGDWKSIQFFIRIIFSIFLGVVISHPFVIRIFEDKIIETQTNIWIETKDSTRTKIVNYYDKINKPLKNEAIEVTIKLDSLSKAHSAELGGASGSYGGYFVTDDKGNGPNAKKLEKNIKENDSLLRELKRLIANNDSIAQSKTNSEIQEKKIFWEMVIGQKMML